MYVHMYIHTMYVSVRTSCTPAVTWAMSRDVVTPAESGLDEKQKKKKRKKRHNGLLQFVAIATWHGGRAGNHMHWRGVKKKNMHPMMGFTEYGIAMSQSEGQA